MQLPLWARPVRLTESIRRLVAIAVTGWFVTLGTTAAAETWAERLGYPAGAKVAVMHARQAGVSFAANAGVEHGLTDGVATSATAIAVGPWFDQFAAGQLNHTGADVGLTLAVTSEWSSQRWRPALPYSNVPSLVDGDGFLTASVSQYLANADPEQVRVELEAQLQRAINAGLRPTHLTAHQGLLFARLDLAEVYLGIARRHWIPAVVIELTPDHIERFQAAGFPLDEDLIRLIRAYPMPKVDELAMLPPANAYEEKQQAVLEMLASLKPGLTHVEFSPAVADGGLKRLAGDWRQRVWAGRLLQDEQVREAITTQQIVLTNWIEIMDRFEGRSGPEQAE